MQFISIQPLPLKIIHKWWCTVLFVWVQVVKHVEFCPYLESLDHTVRCVDENTVIPGLRCARKTIHWGPANCFLLCFFASSSSRSCALVNRPLSEFQRCHSCVAVWFIWNYEYIIIVVDSCCRPTILFPVKTPSLLCTDFIWRMPWGKGSCLQNEFAVQLAFCFVQDILAMHPWSLLTFQRGWRWCTWYLLMLSQLRRVEVTRSVR